MNFHEFANWFIDDKFTCAIKTNVLSEDYHLLLMIFLVTVVWLVFRRM